MQEKQELRGLFEAINSFVVNGETIPKELKFNHGTIIGLNFLGSQELRLFNILLRGSAPQKRKYSSVDRKKLEKVFFEEWEKELDWERLQLSIENLLNVKIIYPPKFLKLNIENGYHPNNEGFYPILEGLKVYDSTLFWNINECTIIEALDMLAA